MLTEEQAKQAQEDNLDMRLNLKQMFEAQAATVRKEKQKKELETSYIPKVVSPKSIIHKQQRKMSSKKCLEKHQREAQMKRDREEKARNRNITVVKAKDVK